MDLQTKRTIPSYYQRVPHTAPEPAAPSMWTRSEVIGIAKASCTFCHGYGMLPVLYGVQVPCNCVFRAIFRICHARYRECEVMAAHTNGLGLERGGGPTGYRLYSRKRQEFTADFDLVARRILVPADYELFRLHHLGTADWRVCCRKLNVDRGTFFHRVYSVAASLGRMFAELRPYPLYPIRDYFGGVVQSSNLTLLTPELDAEEAPPPGLFQWGGHRDAVRY